jgi:hypothetical protein
MVKYWNIHYLSELAVLSAESMKITGVALQVDVEI